MRRFRKLCFSVVMAMTLTATACASNEVQTDTTAENTQTDTQQETELDITDEADTTEFETTTPEESEDQIEGGFHVEGTKLLDANGEEFVMRGVNEAHSWYSAQDTVSLQAISETGSNVVRLVCGSGATYNADSVATLQGLIEECKELDMIVILEVHDGTGDNNISTLEQIADYWISVKDALIGEEAYVILNIANEWYGNWNQIETWAEGYEEVIPKLREAGIENTIMVDSAGWGQYAQSIGDYGKAIFDSDPEQNTMFSVHMYGTAGKNESVITQNLKYATDQDLCVCVGEFGYKHSDGDVDEAYIMEYCTENNIGYLGWSWKGNSGGVEYLDIAESFDGSTLSADWGEVLINGEYGIRETSEPCSIFQ